MHLNVIFYDIVDILYTLCSVPIYVEIYVSTTFMLTFIYYLKRKVYLVAIILTET